MPSEARTFVKTLCAVCRPGYFRHLAKWFSQKQLPALRDGAGQKVCPEAVPGVLFQPGDTAELETWLSPEFKGCQPCECQEMLRQKVVCHGWEQAPVHPRPLIETQGHSFPAEACGSPVPSRCSHLLDTWLTATQSPCRQSSSGGSVLQH